MINAPSFNICLYSDSNRWFFDAFLGTVEEDFDAPEDLDDDAFDVDDFDDAFDDVFDDACLDDAVESIDDVNDVNDLDDVNDDDKDGLNEES